MWLTADLYPIVMGVTPTCGGAAEVGNKAWNLMAFGAGRIAGAAGVCLTGRLVPPACPIYRGNTRPC